MLNKKFITLGQSLWMGNYHFDILYTTYLRYRRNGQAVVNRQS
ncbi:MAG: hypothetical protein ABH867_01985 [Patescibacteria group bacterium]